MNWKKDEDSDQDRIIVTRRTEYFYVNVHKLDHSKNPPSNLISDAKLPLKFKGIDHSRFALEVGKSVLDPYDETTSDPAPLFRDVEEYIEEQKKEAKKEAQEKKNPGVIGFVANDIDLKLEKISEKFADTEASIQEALSNQSMTMPLQ